MDKNSKIGLVLMALILFGFTFYQSKQYEKQQIWQAQQDSIAIAEQAIRDSIYRAENPNAGKESNAEAVAQNTNDGAISGTNNASKAGIYKDSLLNRAMNKEEEFYMLSNDKLEVAFTTKGAQPYSASLKNYKTYDSTKLYLFEPGQSEYGVMLYAGENINTKDFVFELEEKTDSTIVMKLPFEGGGFIRQSYTLKEDSYVVSNDLSFIGMQNVIPANVSILDVDWSMVIPRMEKGYKNEVRYSKLDYYLPGESKPDDLGSGKTKDERIDASVSWFAFQQQFFSAIIRAPKDFVSGEFKSKFFQEDDPSKNLMACAANMRAEFKGAYQDDTIPFEFYFGPNHYKTLKSFDQKYEKIIPLGGSLVGWFTKYLIIPTFDFLHRYIANFGIIILLMTIFIKLLLSPLTLKSYKSSAMMQAVRPEMDKINEKYPKQEDAMKKQQETMALYKRAGINPMGGCLPMLLQFPILWAMFRFFPASIELRQQHFLWAEDLSAYDSILDFGFRIPLLGDHISLFALLMAVSMFIFSKMNSQQMSSKDPNMAGMRFMSVWLMPVMMFFICNGLSSGLSYYYLLSNIIMLLQTWVIRRYFVDQDAILAKIEASKGKPLPKSKWQQRLEEAQKMQQQAQKERRKRR